MVKAVAGFKGCSGVVEDPEAAREIYADAQRVSSSTSPASVTAEHPLVYLLFP